MIKTPTFVLFVSFVVRFDFLIRGDDVGPVARNISLPPALFAGAGFVECFAPAGKKRGDEAMLA